MRKRRVLEAAVGLLLMASIIGLGVQRQLHAKETAAPASGGAAAAEEPPKSTPVTVDVGTPEPLKPASPQPEPPKLEPSAVTQPAPLPKPPAPAPKEPPVPPQPSDPIVQTMTGYPDSRPLGFGNGLRLPDGVKPIRTFDSGLWLGGNGSFLTRVHGTAYTTELPGVGAAPDGHLWVLVDAQIYMISQQGEPLQLPGMVRFALQDAGMTQFEITLHEAASRAVQSPFVSQLSIGSSQTVRGLVAFAVPSSYLNEPSHPYEEIWVSIQCSLGHSPEKGPWNTQIRGTAISFPNPKP